MKALRSHRRELLIAGAVVLVAVGAFLTVHGGAATGAGTGAADGHAQAVITQEGAIVQTIDLDVVAEPYEFCLEHAGGYNLVQVEPGRIRVVDADCPDGVCVGTSWIDAPGVAIACIPHRLSITVQQTGPTDPDALDAVTQ